MLNSAVRQLKDARVPSPRMNAELLLMFALERDRAYLYGHPEQELTVEEQTRYAEALEQRSRGIPAQYITGHQEFWGMDLIVSPAVLIPGPEIEHVIAWSHGRLIKERKRLCPLPRNAGPEYRNSYGGVLVCDE